jgi:four helix bundle protein
MEDQAFRSYRDLRVWQEGMALAEACYRPTRDFPREELFGLTTQIRRAAVSIPANIAEGWGRESTGNYIQFLRTAQGSCKELETHVILAQRVLDGCESNLGPLLTQCEAVGKMLRGLIRSLQE